MSSVNYKELYQKATLNMLSWLHLFLEDHTKVITRKQYGICSNILPQEGDREYANAVSKLMYEASIRLFHKGLIASIDYPIYDTSINMTPMRQYEELDKYSGKQLTLRKEYACHLIKELTLIQRSKPCPSQSH